MTEHRLTDRELQSLRNLGNESELAADEIVRLRAELAQPDTVRVPRAFIQELGTLVHNYQMRARDSGMMYDGMASDAFADAYARCGRELKRVWSMIAAPKE